MNDGFKADCGISRALPRQIRLTVVPQAAGWTRRATVAGIATAFAAGAGVIGCKTASLSNRGELITVNGDHQWLLVTGSWDARALLLILHGGPGGSETLLFRHFNRSLESRYLVAYWDQRGAGHSYDPKQPPSHMTVDQLVQDLGVVVARLHARYRLPIVLLGHSWGGALGLLHAHRWPTTVAGLIGVAPVVNMPAQVLESYEFAVREAQDRKDGKAIQELGEIGPPPFDVAALMIKDRWVESFGGYFAPGFHRNRVAVSALLHGETSIGEIRKLIAANRFSLESMWPEVQSLDVSGIVRTISVPIAFLLGRLDHQVPPREAADYLRRLASPAKSMHWFERSAHNIPFEQPEEFGSTVLALVERWTTSG